MTRSSCTICARRGRNRAARQGAAPAFRPTPATGLNYPSRSQIFGANSSTPITTAMPAVTRTAAAAQSLAVWARGCGSGAARSTAASIAVFSDGLLHYYLSGTADAHLKGAPMKNVVEEMIGFGAERELAVNFGGGLKEARMPHEKAADIEALGLYAKQQIEAFYHRTGRKLHMEIEPGTFIAANMGYVVTTVRDMKKTGESGLCFAVVDGGMDLNARPLLYGAQHPFYVVSGDGRLLSSEFEDTGTTARDMMVVGTCCESGDSLCLDSHANSAPRRMAEPEIGDLIVIGGAGAYCAAMTPFNYNSHLQAPEVLYTTDKQLKLIRKRQTLEQMVANEL